MKFGKAMFFAFTLSLLAGFVFADPTSQLKAALTSLCIGLRDMVPVAAMLMVLLESVIYATGQMMGAETRARANVWATACLTGALIAILIVVVAQPVLTAINNGTAVQCT